MENLILAFMRATVALLWKIYTRSHAPDRYAIAEFNLFKRELEQYIKYIKEKESQ